jgi:putative DNA primase/helicase
MLDFNQAAPPLAPHAPDTDRREIRAALLARLEDVLRAMFPAGTVRGGRFHVGDIRGTPGDSLEVVLEGEKAGLWHDRAEGLGGDIFDAIAGRYGLDVQRDFAGVLEQAVDLLGRIPLPTQQPKRRNALAVDDLGPPTAQWQYRSADGKLLAVVYRYEPSGRGKEFRPWDVARRRHAPPSPRPLYNLPGIAKADTVVLAEGEKCADALIAVGACGTTAMHGANAPVDKTDWAPLAGKHLLAWPDKDRPGWDHAVTACEAALAAGALSAHVLLPPEDRPEGWDAADALAEGFDVQGFLASGPRMKVERAVEELDPQWLLAGVDWQTEDGLATAFTQRYGGDWRYCAGWGRWLQWDGQRWSTDHVLHVLHLSRGICRAASRLADTPRLRARLASASCTSSVEKLARSDPRHATTTDEWDRDIWLLNTPGGVVDLRDGSLRAHARDDRMTKIATAQPRGSCPTWLSFLDAATAGDTELQAYLARMVGYCLTGSTQEHALFFLYGTGGNGKSVFINTVASILGDYATHAPMDTFMEARGDRHPTDMAGLRGARLVCSVETEQGRRWAESRIKALTGGDPVSARFMRQDFFQFVPQFKLIVAGNHKPAIRNVDEAMKRRLHLVPFTVTIAPENRDRQLAQKLLAERDGILAWAVRGCLEWLQHGLMPPQSVVDATEEYFDSEDATGRWIAERCVRHANAKALTIELYADFKEWAELNGEFVGSQRRFADALIARRFERWRNSVGARGFVGLGLKAPTALPKQHLPYKDD